ncbi:MAG TPA: TolC family protein [Gemmatimonadaceae bacterium]|nr:TolC family protein [Gemmatimonadaceae bacterium]
MVASRAGSIAGAIAGALLLTGSWAHAQQSPPAARPNATHTLSLDDAIRIAQIESQDVGVARAGLTRSTGQLYQSRSQALPQITGSAGYTRTLASQFQGVSFGGPDTAAQTNPSLCAPNIPANATAAERTAALNQAVTCQSSGGGGFNFASVGFGAANEWTVGLSFSQTLYSGGKVQAQNQSAEAQQRSAGIEVDAQRAEAALDAAQDYYNAALADRLLIIADSALAETEDVLRLAKLGHQVGEQSDFDLLKAQVTRDNQVPVVLQARTNRQIAYLQLKQILNMSLDDSLNLSTTLDETGSAPPAGGPAMDTVVADRAPVRELEESVRGSEGQLKATTAERLPSVALVSSYQRLYFPSGVLPSLGEGKQNWTVGVSTSVTVFNGGRTHGDELVAQSNLDEAQQRLKQGRQLAQLDTRVALNELEQAQAEWTAVQGTVDQAQKAYNIDEIRFREGISTQTDLAQSRLLLEQSMANRAQAARDLAVARIRLSLLKDLPIQGAAGSSQSGAQGGGQSSQAAPTSPSQAPSTQSAGGAGGAGGSGGTSGGSRS